MNIPGTATRYGKASIIAALITFAIFFIMQMLVAEKETLALDENKYKTVGLYEIPPRDMVVEIFPEPVDDVEAPEIDPLEVVFEGPTSPGTPTFEGPDLKPEGLEIVPSSNAIVPWVKMTPIYPPRARQDGVEGYVILKFTVNERGQVENIILLEESPKNYGFAKSAIAAAKNFKYRARVIDGKAVATPGIREKFEYSLEDDG